MLDKRCHPGTKKLVIGSWDVSYAGVLRLDRKSSLWQSDEDGPMLYRRAPSCLYIFCRGFA